MFMRRFFLPARKDEAHVEKNDLSPRCFFSFGADFPCLGGPDSR